MNKNSSAQILAGALGLVLALSGCAVAGTAEKAALPKTTEDGLALVPDSKADAVYRRPGISLAGYTKIVLIDPKVSFRANWQSDTNHNRMMDRIDNDDVERMIATGESLLTEEFTGELTKGGYNVVKTKGPDVLAVRVAIVDLDVFAPQPNGMGSWGKTYSEGTGAATMVVELYDSVTGQLLARAYDRKDDRNSGWAGAHSSASNMADARWVINEWAKMLVKGLTRAKAAPAS